MPLECHVAGKNRVLLCLTTNFTHRMNSPSTGGTQLFGESTAIPKPLKGQEIRFRDTDAPRIEFVGQIDKIAESIYDGTMAHPAFNWKIDFQDLSAVLSRRIVSKTYSPQSAATIAIDIITSFCGGENITTTNVTSSATTTQDLKFDGVTALEALRRLCEMTGDLVFIDPANDLNMYAPGDGGDAPLTLTDNGADVRDLVVTDTLVGFTNTAFVRTNNNLGEESPLA